MHKISIQYHTQTKPGIMWSKPSWSRNRFAKWKSLKRSDKIVSRLAAVDSPKKQTNLIFCLFLLFTAKNKTNLFIHFLGESRACLRFYLTFRNLFHFFHSITKGTRVSKSMSWEFFGILRIYELYYDIVMRVQNKFWVSDLVPSACSHVLFPRRLFDQFWFHKREHFSFFRTNIVVVHKDIYHKYYKNSNVSYTCAFLGLIGPS